MAKEEGGKEKLLMAIRRAAAELGRAPSRGELRRITGVSHYRVLAEFPTLREAVRAAGLEPNPKGEKISTEDLLADWKRVAEKLGRRPSRAEYVREGRYSAGAFVGRFGSWSGICETPLTTKDTKEHGGRTKISRELTRKTRIKTQLPESPKVPKNPKWKNVKAIRSNGAGYAERSDKANRTRLGEPGESVLHNFSRVPLAQVPAPVVGMRRVTEEIAQMVVNTLMGSGYWLSAIGSWPEGTQPSAFSVQPRTNPFTTEVTEEHGGERSVDRIIGTSGHLHPTTRNPRALGTLFQPKQNQEFNHKGHEGTQRESGTELERCDFGDRMRLAPRGLYKDRPVMGEPFDRRPMTNAPVNELGVMVLFGMVATRLGLQVESVQGKFPDCIARRQVAPGKWQYLRIEFEYESKNFRLHGHDPKGCDVIVCWKHNWKDVPADLEVIELCRLIGMS